MRSWYKWNLFLVNYLIFIRWKVEPQKINSCNKILWMFYFSQDGFVVRIFATSTEPVLQQELQLKLARKCLHACGISLFDLEKDLHIISKMVKKTFLLHFNFQILQKTNIVFSTLQLILGSYFAVCYYEAHLTN